MDSKKFTQWVTDHPYAMPPLEERQLSSKLRPCIRLRKNLPQAVLQNIFCYLRIFSGGMTYDLDVMYHLLDPSNDEGLSYFDTPQEVVDRLESLQKGLADHSDKLSLFDGYADALLLSANETHPQKEFVMDLIQKITRRLDVAFKKWRAIVQWQSYYNKMRTEPIIDLRSNVRAMMSVFIAESNFVREMFHDDCVVTKYVTEVNMVAKNISSVEALGDPKLTQSDFRSIFWRIGLAYPDSSCEGYKDSITYEQAVTMNLFEGNPVYSWEGRQIDEEKECSLCDLQQSLRQKSSNFIGSACSTPASSMRQSLYLQQQQQEEETHEQNIFNLSTDTFTNTTLTPCEQQSLVFKAGMMTADRMASQGCEVCESSNIKWAAISRMPPSEDGLALCKDCFHHYSESPSVSRLYYWFFVEDLVRLGAKVFAKERPQSDQEEGDNNNSN